MATVLRNPVSIPPRVPERAAEYLSARPSTWRVAANWLLPLLILCAIVFVSSLALRELGAGERATQVRLQLAALLLDNPGRNLIELAALALCVALAFWRPAAVTAKLRTVRRALDKLAAHRTQAILCSAVTPLALRLAMLPALPVPQPMVADEFGYLLLADTLASGRLANAVHPLWPFFEAIYQFHQPVYASIYPVAPAAPMALALLTGLTPWLGVWLGAGVMCALLCWMLQGWLAPRWALAGGLIAAGRLAVAGPWMNTYWGGAAAAAGGALLLGALPRILRARRWRDSLLFGLGLGTLAQSRPYEGLLFTAPLALVIVVWLVKSHGLRLPGRLGRVAVPLAMSAVVVVAATAYYNWRVTGHPARLPYQLHQQIYGTPQGFFWQRAVLDAPRAHQYRDVADVFEWQLNAYRSNFSWHSQRERLEVFWNFYLQPLLMLPLLVAPLALRRRRGKAVAGLRVAAAALALMLAGSAFYPFYFPHYSAPGCAALLLLVMAGMRSLRAVRLGQARTGRALVDCLLVAVFAATALTVAGTLLRPWNAAASTPRGDVLHRLRTLGGRHLVIVQYSPQHSFHYGSVFNDADIDASPVVWARDLGSARNRALLEYYPDRAVWLFQPDQQPPQLIPYPGKPFIAALVSATGRRDAREDGVSAGSIAMILGANFGQPPTGASLRPLGALPLLAVEATAELGVVFAPAGHRGALAPATPPAVTVGGLSAHVLGVASVQDDQALLVRVPPGLPPGPTPLRLRVDGLVPVERTLRILPAAPGVFQMRMPDGHLRAILLHADGGLVDLEHPARRGEMLRALCTGVDSHALVVGVHHRGVRVASLRAAEGMPGVDEVTFEVPSDSPSGSDVPFSVGARVGGAVAYSNQSVLPVE